MTIWQLFEVLAWRRACKARARGPPSIERADAERLRKRVTIQSILVQSWPSWALNDHKEEIFHLAPCSLMQKWLQMAQNALGRQSGEAGKEKRIKHGPFNQGFESFLATFTLKTRFLVIDLFFVVI